MITVSFLPAPTNHPNGKLWLDAAQDNLVHTAITKVLVDTVSTGYTDGIEDAISSRILPGVAGLYQISAQLCLGNCIDNKDYELFIKITGTIKYEKLHTLTSGGDNRISIGCSFPFWFGDSDYAELFVRSMAGVDTVDLVPLERDTFLAVTRIK